MRELRQNASVHLGRVRAGETLEVTDREKRVALASGQESPVRLARAPCD